MSREIIPWVALVILPACGGSSAGGGTPTTPVAIAQPSSSPTPFPPPPVALAGCEPWPNSLGDMFAKLPLPDGLCFKRDPEGVILGRNRGGWYDALTKTVWVGYLSTFDPEPTTHFILLHELCHAHQHWAVLQAGFAEWIGDPNHPDSKWHWLRYNLDTREGQEHMAAGGYTFLGPGGQCTQPYDLPCYSADTTKCEGFCNSSGPRMPPLEDSAEFCMFWYSHSSLGPPTTIPDRDGLKKSYPRRHAWATKWLP